jgi:thiamine-phosphate pyrophosphorylase
LVEQARGLMSVLAGTGIPLLINDRVDVALAVGAHGVHIGQSDLSPRDARRLLGPQPLLGLSITCEDQLREEDLVLVDYLGVGPLYPTATKSDAAPALGTTGLRRIAQRTTLPIVGIGGINAENAPLVVAAGACGVAVVSAICSADDPAEATRALVANIRQSRSPEPDVARPPCCPTDELP